MALSGKQHSMAPSVPIFDGSKTKACASLLQEYTTLFYEFKMIISLIVMLVLASVSVQGECPRGYKGSSSTKSESQKILENFLNERDQATIRSTWNTAKKNGNIGPKTFLRYFELKPEAQKMFPAFADVEHAKLPTNDDFLAQAQSCVSSLNSYIEHLGQNPKNCPFIAKAKGKYHHEDLKLLGVTLMGVLEEELGERFTPESKESWKRGLREMNEGVLKKSGAKR